MGATDVFNCTVYVVKVDLDMAGVDEDDEDDPGRYIAVNTDDDNENSTQDKNDEGTVDYEDDLVSITLSITPSVSDGKIKLKAGSIGQNLFRVWTDQTKGTQLNVINPTDPEDPTHAIWDLSQESFPETLWVEGYYYDLYNSGGLRLEYTNGYTVDSDAVIFNPIQVELFMDGVTEDNEEFPGNYILYNKNDNDNDGVPDYDDGFNKDGIPGNEDDENMLEEDLVKITLGNAQPYNKLTGTVTFDVISGDSKIKIWEAYLNKKKGTEITDFPITYNNPIAPLKTFYVEGIEESGAREVEFKLSYTVDGFTIEDIIKATVVHVELFRDSAYTQPLDDHEKPWPKPPGPELLRSARYIFGEDDPIYVQVKNIGTDPDTAEIKYDVVSVNSAAGGSAYLTLYETGSDTQIFNNSTSPGELLYLSTFNSEGTIDTIKVTDEEVLNFCLKIPPDGGIYKESVDVMVDRGEFLAVAGSESSDMHWINNITYFNQNISDAKSKMQNDYKYWQNGYMIGKHYDIDDYGPSDQQYESSKVAALGAGAEPGFSCADFLFCTSHGDQGILTMIRTKSGHEITWDPHYIEASSGWAGDVEFCAFIACSVLGTSGDPDMFVGLWINNLFPKGIHAVLSTSGDPSNEALNDDFGEFLDRLKNGETVVNAYKQACYVGLNTPYGILVREENLNDYVLTSVASAESTLSRDYTTIDHTFYYFYYDDNQQIINPAQEGQNIQGSDQYYNTKRKIAEAMEFKDEIQIDILSLDEEKSDLSVPEDFNSLFEHYRMEKFSFSGWNKIADTNMVRHNVAISEVSDRINLEPLGLYMPSDYVLDSRGKMMVSKYIANTSGMHQLGETWCEGETIEFIREYNGHKIFDDRFRVSFQNNNIISYSLTRHPLKKTGASIVKKPHFKSKDSSIKWDVLHPSIVYRVKGKALVPFWQVQYDNYLFHYDIEKANNMH